MSTSGPLAIEARNLTKSYGDNPVLRGVDIAVPEGTVFSLLGPNGAGKTTAVGVLSTLIRPDGGEAAVAGHDLEREPDAVRRAIGVTGQFAAVDGILTSRENLHLMGRLHHLGKRETRRRAEALLERFDLSEAATRPPATYSGGMKRRLDLAMCLMGDPRVIFLDEPTTGLDPRSRRTVWQIVRELTADGATVFLTTQYLEEADELADRVAVLDGGRIVAEGTPEQLKRTVAGGHIRLRLHRADQVEPTARALGASGFDAEQLTVQVPSDGTVASLREVLDALDREGVDVDELTVHTPDLDDVFLSLTGDAA